MRRTTLDVTYLSSYRQTSGGNPLRSVHIDDPSKVVAVPLPTLPDNPTAESLAYARKSGPLTMQRALEGFSNHEPKTAGVLNRGGAGERVSSLDEKIRKCFADTNAGSSEFSGLSDLFGMMDTSPTASASDAKRITYGSLVIDALSESSGGDLTLAKRAFDRLKEGLRFPPQATAGQAPDHQRIDRAAWRTAQHLAATANGYDCLRELAGSDWPAIGLARLAPRLWLQAADELVKVTGCDADPASVASEAERWADAAGINAAVTTKAHPASIVQACAKLWRTDDVEGLSAVDKGALLAARQGYFTDGPGTPFAAIKTRIARFVNVAIARATSDRPELESDGNEVPLAVAPRRTWTSGFARPFGYSKSAVVAMKHGVEGASHGPWEKDEAALDKATRTALVALHAGFAEPRAARGWPPNNGKLVADRRAIDSLVSAAELEVLASAAAGDASIEYGSRLHDEMLDQIAQRAAEKIGQILPPAEDAGYREARAYRALVAFGRRLAPNADAAAPARAREQIRKHLTNHSDVVDARKIEVWQKGLRQEPSSEAQASFDTIGRIALGETIKPRGTRTEDYRDAGNRIIDALEGSGKAIITDGGTVGFSTRGISASAASASWLGPRINLRGSHGRQAVFAYTRSTADYKISFGTQRRNHLSAGGGLQMGQYVGVARLAVNIEAEYQRHNTEQSTVDLSVARRLNSAATAYDEKTAKEQLREVNRYLFDNAGKGKSERALWNDLGSRFFDNDDFSVALNDQTGKRRGHETGITFRPGVRVDVGNVAMRANAIIGATHARVYRATLDTDDKAGHVQIESHRFGQGNRFNVQAGINFTLSDALYGAPHLGSTDPTNIASVSVFTPNMVSVAATVHNTFHQAKATLVREGGKLQVRASNADTEFMDFEAYKRVLSDDRAWLLAFGTKPGGPMPITKEDIEITLRAGSKRIGEYLSHLSANTAPTLRYIARRRLREHAATSIDSLDDRIASLKRRNRDSEIGEVEDLQRQRDELLQRQDSWLPTELLTVQVTEAQFAVGIRLGLQVATQRGARGEHEVTSLKLKPGEADDLDKIWPKQNERGGARENVAPAQTPAGGGQINSTASA